MVRTPCSLWLNCTLLSFPRGMIYLLQTLFFPPVQTVAVSQMAPLVLSLPRLWRSSWPTLKDICGFSLIPFLCVEQPWADSVSTTNSNFWFIQSHITSFRSICILPVLFLPQSQEYHQGIGMCMCFVSGGELNFPRVQQQLGTSQNK